jgi:hypothetical protein
MKKTIMALSMLAFAGCFTIFESEYPAVEMASAGNADVKVQLSGFEAAVTTYEVLYGYETSYRYHHYYGYRRNYGYWGPSTVMTETYVPQTRATSAYIDRATEILELNGFNAKTDKPEYRVEVKFDGPFVSDGERAAEAAWTIFSLLTADYGVHTWTAKLKIYDVATGKLLMHYDYSERYSALVWGPIPLFSPAGSEKTSANSMQRWCLMALTDRAMAYATAFLAAQAKTAKAE